jgi:hypothetical protein
MHRTVLQAMTMLAALTLVSCMQLRTVADCRRLVQRINPQLDEIEPLVKKAPPTAADYEAIGTRYEQLSKELTGQTFHDSSLEKAVEDYRRILEASAKNSRAYAKALTDKNDRQIGSILNAQNGQMQKEKLVTKRIATLCRGK